MGIHGIPRTGNPQEILRKIKLVNMPVYNPYGVGVAPCLRGGRGKGLKAMEKSRMSATTAKREPRCMGASGAPKHKL